MTIKVLKSSSSYKEVNEIGDWAVMQSGQKMPTPTGTLELWWLVRRDAMGWDFVASIRSIAREEDKWLVQYISKEKYGSDKFYSQEEFPTVNELGRFLATLYLLEGHTNHD